MPYSADKARKPSPYSPKPYAQSRKHTREESKVKI